MNIMELKVGYIKDFLASINFVLMIIFGLQITDLNKYKKYGIILLFIFLVVDGLFSLNSEYHCMNYGMNIPSYVLSSSVVIVLGFYYYVYKNV